MYICINFILVTMNENWKPIPGYEGLYEASPMGLIRNAKTGRIFKKSRVVLLTGPDCKPHLHQVNQIVAKLFIPNIDPEVFPWLRHRDGDTSNCHVNNLEWISRELSNREKRLNYNQVLQIRKLAKNGIKAEDLARRYKVNLMTVYNIISHRTWKHLPPDELPDDQRPHTDNGADNFGAL